MGHKLYSDLDLVSVGKVINMVNGTSAQDGVTVAQLNAAIEGISWKDNVRAAATVNVNLAAPGATIDGVTMAANDRFLAPAQTAGAENGLYIYNGAATPATRAPDASTWAELVNAVVIADEGTSNAGVSFRNTTVTGTLGTTTITFSAFLTGSPAASESVAGIMEIATQAETNTGTDDTRAVTPLKLKTSKLFNKTVAFSIGDASATSFNCDHNLNTRDVAVQVMKNSGNYDSVICDVTRPTVNRVTVTFPAGYVPSANEFRVLVQGTQA